MLRLSELRPDSFLFAGLLALLVWVPMPFGSEPMWARYILITGVGVLGLLYLVVVLFSKNGSDPKSGSDPSHKLEVRDMGSDPNSRSDPVHELVVRGLWSDSVNKLVIGCFIVWVGYVASWAMFGKLDTHGFYSHLLLSGAYFIMFLLGMVLVNTPERIRVLCLIIIGVGLFQALYGSLMMLSGIEYGFFLPKRSGIGLANGTFINRNHYAAFIVMSLSVGIGYMVASLQGFRFSSLKGFLRDTLKLLLGSKTRLRLVLVVMVIALVMSRSRMGNIAFFVSFLACASIALLRMRHLAKSLVILFVSIIVIDVVIVGVWFGVDKVVERLEQTSLEREARDEINIYALKQWQDKPVIGHGHGTFPVVFPQYRQPDVNGLYRHTHNDYLQFATEVGIVGLLILAGMVLPCVYAAGRAMFVRKDPLMRGIGFGALMGMLAMLLHATVEFNFQIPANVVYFLMLMVLGLKGLEMTR